MSKSFKTIKNAARKKNTPELVKPSVWANAVNWTIEAWNCYLKGQKWTHGFEICCPEQYYLLLNDKGTFILEDTNGLTFTNNLANAKWMQQLQAQIIEMQTKGEWVEAFRWTKLLKKIKGNVKPTPNEDHLVRTKAPIKGQRLIRINSAA